MTYDKICMVKSQYNGGNILLPWLRVPQGLITQRFSLLATEWKRDLCLLIAYFVPDTMHISSCWTSQQPYEVDIINLTLHVGKRLWEVNLPSYGGWDKRRGIWTQVWAHWSKTVNVFCCPSHVRLHCPPACFLGGMGKNTWIKPSATCHELQTPWICSGKEVTPDRMATLGLSTHWVWDSLWLLSNLSVPCRGQTAKWNRDGMGTTASAPFRLSTV